MLDENNNENNFSSNLFDNFESYEENLRLMRLNLVYDNSLDSKQKIIKSYEVEYDYIQNQIKALVYSNDEMSKFDLNDNIIIESRSENLKFMQKYLMRLNQIKSEIVKLDAAHRFLDDSEILKNLDEIDFSNKNIQNEKIEIGNENYTEIDQLDNENDDVLMIENNEDTQYIISEINL